MSDIISLEAEMERCREWIEAALEYSGGTHDFDDVVESVKTGAMQFWPAKDACAVTELLRYPKKKVLHIFLAGGNLETILDMEESARAFAEVNGCTALSMAGRKGWSKVLRQKGFKEAHTTMGKDF